MSDISNPSCFVPKLKIQLALSTSTGGRPAYNNTKEMIEQLRDTGMNWTSVFCPNTIQTKDRISGRRRFDRN